MQTTALHPGFGVEIHDIDLRRVTAASGYPEIRAAFEEAGIDFIDENGGGCGVRFRERDGSQRERFPDT